MQSEEVKGNAQAPSNIEITENKNEVTEPQAFDNIQNLQTEANLETEQNLPTARAMIGPDQDQPQRVSQTEALINQSSSKMRACSPLKIAIALLISIVLGCTFGLYFKQTKPFTFHHDMKQTMSGSVEDASKLFTDYNLKDGVTYPVKVSNASIKDTGLTILVTWRATRDFRNDVQFEEFTIQAMNTDGYYEDVPCERHAMASSMVGNFGCTLDHNDMIFGPYIAYKVMIVAPDGKYHYAVPEGYEDEKLYPLIYDAPRISISGDSILIEWETLQEHISQFDDFTVEAMNQEGNYEAVKCDSFKFMEKADEGIFKCRIAQHTFMVDDFNLEYGQRVKLRIQGSDGDYYVAETKDREPDGDKLRPYVSDLLEFGYTKNVFFQLDHKDYQYPTNDRIALMKPNDFSEISIIRIAVRKTESNITGLAGIQLLFTDGTESPYYVDLTEGDLYQESFFELDHSRRIAAIQMKSYKHELTGLRLFDETGQPLFDYQWEDSEVSGTWSKPQKVGKGRSIFGLVTNKPARGIQRIGFMLWDKFPQLVEKEDD